MGLKAENVLDEIQLEYAGLSVEEVEIMRLFEGERGKKVVHKAGFFPGAVFIVSSWYIRTELQQRLALFYTASAFSGAFSGLLAYAIAKLDGVGGVAAWRWIFLLEGAVTVTIDLVMPFIIIQSPERANWLTLEEKRFVDILLRLAGVRSATEEGDKFSRKLLFHAMFDWKVNLGIIMAWANAAPSSAFEFTLPKILTEFGYTSSKAQLMSIPPYVAGGISSWLVGRTADRFAWKFPFVVGPMCVLLTGLAILYSSSKDLAAHVPVMYFAVILAQIGIYPLLPGISAWKGNNLAPSWKRSIGLAWMLAAGNFGSTCPLRTQLHFSQDIQKYANSF
ncbi:hypothetical protein ACJQWK_10155 [Exserohilum turcicum]